MSNIRIKNSSQSSRTESTGITLGGTINGSITSSEIEGFDYGISISGTNGSQISENKFIDCLHGVLLTGAAAQPIFKYNTLYSMSVYPLNTAITLAGSNAQNIMNNTVDGYQTAINASNSSASLSQNIFWNVQTMTNPVVNQNSTLYLTYNNFNTGTEVVSGTGNINADPLFVNAALEDFSLQYNSPCIDAGNPLVFDPDGSISDIGAIYYHHIADFSPSVRFIQAGTTVRFIDRSIGHSHPVTTYAWDIGADGSIESTQAEGVFTFENSGSYNVRLTITSGPLQDTKTYQNLIVVQSQALQAPQDIQISMTGDSINLTWLPVTNTQAGDPLGYPVPYYVVYYSDSPSGFFDYITFTESETSTVLNGLLNHNQLFFFVIGFDGGRAELMNFIGQNPRIHKEPNSSPQMMKQRK